MCSTTHVHIFLTAMMLKLTSAGGDKNFEKLFESNIETFENFPVVADSPLPNWLKGQYVRNGLGQFEMGQRKVSHAFDAFAKLCSFTFNGSDTMLFSSRILETQFYQASLEDNTIAPYLLFDAPDPPFSFAEKTLALMHGIDNTNINVLSLRKVGRNMSYAHLAISDFWQSYEFDLDSLETLSRVDPYLALSGYIDRYLPLPSSAHPVREYGTENYISYVSMFDMTPWGQNSINIIRIKNNEDRDVVAKIPVKQIPYMHSLAVTKRYAIILAHPLYVNVWRMLKTANPSQSLDWYPEEYTQIYVVDLHSGKVHMIKSKVKARFNMHHINSYQISNHRIIIDYVTYPDTGFMKSLQLNVMKDRQKRNQINPKAELIRYTIDLKSNTAKMSDFEQTANYEFANTMDMPAINENYRFKKHCIVYGVTFKSDNISMANTTIVKKNLCKAGRDKAWFAYEQYVSEPWFVPRPGGSREDDGLLVSLILDGSNGTSYIAVINPKSMKLVNRINLPTFIPFTLHGNFIDSV